MLVLLTQDVASNSSSWLRWPSVRQRLSVSSCHAANFVTVRRYAPTSRYRRVVDAGRVESSRRTVGVMSDASSISVTGVNKEPRLNDKDQHR